MSYERHWCVLIDICRLGEQVKEIRSLDSRGDFLSARADGDASACAGTAGRVLATIRADCTCLARAAFVRGSLSWPARGL